MNFIHKYLLKHSKAPEVANGKRKISSLCYGIMGTVLLLLLWALIGHLVFRRPGHEQFSGFLPVPAIKAFFVLILDTDFWSSALASLRRVIVGIFIAFFLGLPGGLLIGYYKKLRVTTNPSIQFLRMISPLAWMPIALLVFKTFESAIHFLITVATVWPIILNTVVGVSRVNPQWINMARDQGAKDHQLILHIVIPASVPYILTSLRLALGVAWIVLVPAEFLGISSGLGYLINDARDTMEYDRLMAVVISIGILGFLLDGAIQLVQKRFNWVWVH
jgi:NitT/TauT family transport system permease protein